MGEENSNKKRCSILEYKRGMNIYGVKIKKIYFANKEKEFIILRKTMNSFY